MKRNNSQKRREDSFFKKLIGNKTKIVPRHPVMEPRQDKYGKDQPQAVTFPQAALPTKRRGNGGKAERGARDATRTAAQRRTSQAAEARLKNGRVRSSDGRTKVLEVPE